MRPSKKEKTVPGYCDLCRNKEITIYGTVLNHGFCEQSNIDYFLTHSCVCVESNCKHLAWHVDDELEFMEDKTKNIISELKKIFSVFNKVLFEDRIKPVKISIVPNKKVSLRWVSNSDAIIIGSEFVRMEYSEIPGALLHEMVHIFNYQRNICDVTANQYHNKDFLQIALSVGLIVIKHKTQGWSITSTIYPRNIIDRVSVKKPTKESVLLRNQVFYSVLLDKSIFKSAIADIRERSEKEKTKKPFFLKYQCDCLPPHNSIRSGRRPDGPNAPNILCQECGAIFVCVGG